MIDLSGGSAPRVALRVSTVERLTVGRIKSDATAEAFGQVEGDITAMANGS